MKIYAADVKAQQAQTVFNGKTYTTIAKPPSSPGPHTQRTGDKCVIDFPKPSQHPTTTPTHRQTHCWTCGIVACLIFSVVASVGLFGLLYSAAKPIKYVAGECNIPILPDETQTSGYQEAMSVDEEAAVEIFEVPQIHDNHPATIVYDFYNEITVYLDRKENICFVMALNTSQITPPRSLFEAFIRFTRGDFTINVDAIQQTMYAQVPPIANITALGGSAEALCHELPTYMLVKLGTPSLRKRSVSQRDHRVTYFNGIHLIDLTVSFA